LIEKEIDSFLDETHIREEIGWLLRDIPVSSIKDFMMGYSVGMLTSYALTACVLSKRRYGSGREEDAMEVEEMLRRRLPEIAEKVERELNR
jgi:hypothetical protein